MAKEHRMSDPNIIGVACNSGEEPWVREFFELFKTPWEFYRSDRAYPVVVSTRRGLRDVRSKLLVSYASSPATHTAEQAAARGVAQLVYRDVAFPVYGDMRTLDSANQALVRIHGTAAAAAIEEEEFGMKVVRVGYNLFQEVRILLSFGQPACNALTPTLEIHISMLRDWILAVGIPVVEIPAVPAGYEFIACLTHDVDFMRIRDHKFDHTMWGFLYRASLGSLLRLAKRKISWTHCLRNLKAALSLPAIHLGIRKDFWLEEFERFVSLEHDLKATFFFIPFKNRPGDKVVRRNATRRAAAYDVTAENDLLKELIGKGNEVGVHGIDAWHDALKGREERRRLAETTGKSDLGVRVHWLCFDSASPRILDEAGFQYDSTFGYNETVGYRAGTSQVFRPEGAKSLLELPLHIQDTALFYSGYLDLQEKSAWKVCETLFKNAATYGGVLSILWHTRSLAPERLWGDFYVRLLNALRARRVWFATAGQAVEWFRNRRALSFRANFSGPRLRLDIEYAGPPDVDRKPNLMLRVHMPPSRTKGGHHKDRSFMDIPWTGETVMEVSVA